MFIVRRHLLRLACYPLIVAGGLCILSGCKSTGGGGSAGGSGAESADGGDGGDVGGGVPSKLVFDRWGTGDIEYSIEPAGDGSYAVKVARFDREPAEDEFTLDPGATGIDFGEFELWPKEEVEALRTGLSNLEASLAAVFGGTSPISKEVLEQKSGDAIASSGSWLTLKVEGGEQFSNVGTDLAEAGDGVIGALDTWVRLQL